MIQTENVTIGSKDYVRTYSDENRYAVRNEEEYAEAIDPVNSGRTYTEGNIMDVDGGGGNGAL